MERVSVVSETGWSEAQWMDWRETCWLEPSGVASAQPRYNLNPGTMATPSPRVVAATDRARAEVEGWPLGQYTAGRAWMRAARARVERLWPHPAPALGHGTTAQMSMLLPAICRVFGPLTLVTTHDEHEGAVAGWHHHPGVRVVEVAPEALDSTVRALRPELVLVSHIQWTDGRLNELSALIRSSPGWVIVDVAQSIGVLTPEALEVALEADVVVGSLHKWVAGPAGTGVSWLSARAAAALQGTVWAGHPVDPEAALSRFEPAGAQDFARWAGLDAALAVYASLGPARAAARARALGQRLAEGLARVLSGLPLQFGGTNGWQEAPTVSPGGVVVVHFGATDPYPLYQQLESRRVHVKCIKRGAHNQLRLGVHWSESAARVDEALVRIGEAWASR